MNADLKKNRKNNLTKNRSKEERRTLEIRLNDWTFNSAGRRMLGLKNARKKKECRMLGPIVQSETINRSE